MIKTIRTAIIFSAALVLLMTVQSVAGLGFPDLYRDTGYVRETWFGNDLVTLALGVPLLCVGLILERGGYVLGRLIWLGALGYGVYNFAFYLFGAALNAFFPFYIALFLLFAVTLGLALAGTDAAQAASRLKPKAPLMFIGGYLVFVAFGLTIVWLIMWAAYIFAGKPTPGDPEAFKLVAALDLTMMVPALATGGILLLRRRPLGVVIAALAGVQGSLYLSVLALNGALFIQRGLAEAPGELPVWGTLALATSLVTVVFLANVSGKWAK